MTREEFSLVEIPLVRDERLFPQIARVRRLLEENGVEVEDIGVTGSQAVGVATPQSDVDIFARVPDSQFHSADDLVAGLIRDGIDVLLNWRGVGKPGGTLRGTKTHRRLVEKALREGEPVPSRVLRGYPDLDRRKT